MAGRMATEAEWPKKPRDIQQNSKKKSEYSEPEETENHLAATWDNLMNNAKNLSKNHL